MYTATLEPLLVQCDEAIEMAKAGRIDEARNAMDRIRYFRAVLARDRSLSDATGDLGVPLGIEPELLRTYAEVASAVNARLEVLHRWISESRASFTISELRASREGIQLLVDDALPGIWDFKQDIVVLTQEDGEVIREALRERGQEKFIWITDSPPNNIEDQKSPDKAPDTVFFNPAGQLGAEHLGDMLGNRSVPRVALVVALLNEEDERVFHRVVRSIATVVIGGTTTQWLPQQNVEQWFELIPKLASLNSVMSLKSHFSGADVLVVSPGPSLKSDLQALTRHADRFLIIASMKSLSALFDAGIRPDFAIWQDPRDHSDAIPERDGIHDVPLILNEGSHPAFYNSAFGGHYPYPEPGLLGNPLSKVLHGEDVPVFAGTSVATLSAIMALALGASSVTLLGQDLSIGGGMYVDDDESQDEKKENAPEYLMCKTIAGGEAPTLPNYFSFIGEFQAIARGFKDHATLINSTSSGAYLDGWEHIPFVENPIMLKEAPTKAADVTPGCDTPSERIGDILTALKAMSDRLDHAVRITDEIRKRCLEAVSSGDNDVTIIDLLEQRLKLILDEECPVLKYYTSRQSAALLASTASVQSLEENLRLSADYYYSIGLAAKRLVSLCEKAQAALLE